MRRAYLHHPLTLESVWRKTKKGHCRIKQADKKRTPGLQKIVQAVPPACRKACCKMDHFAARPLYPDGISQKRSMEE
jgi:hypothetical protein